MTDIRILPETGLITLKELAEYLEVGSPSAVQDAMAKNGIKVFRVGQRYHQRFVSLSAISDYLKNQEDTQ